MEYQGSKNHAGGSLFSLGSANASFEQVAIRQINARVEKHYAALSSLCAEYNACVIGPDTYHAKADALRERLTAVSEAAEAFANADGYTERKQALAKAYDAALEASERSSQFELTVAIGAELPDSVGGGELVLPPGGPLPTGSRIWFNLSATKNVHIYLFQKKPSGEVNVLFPDPRIGVTNPVRANVRAQIPPAPQFFRVDDKDVGIEQVYVVASVDALPALETAAANVQSGAVKTVAQDETLAALARARPGAAPEGCKTRALELDGPSADCARTRGIVLGGPPSNLAAAKSMRASARFRTDPGDGVIVKIIPFEHVTAPGFAAARQKYDDAGAEGQRTRGVIME